MGASNYLARLEFAMAHGPKFTAVAKGDVEAFIRRPNLTKFAVKKRLAAVENCMLQFEELVPWPALAQSMLEDVINLRMLLDRVKD